jgi:hypothetical protein
MPITEKLIICAALGAMPADTAALPWMRYLGIVLKKAGILSEYIYVQFLRICHWTSAPSYLLEGDAILLPHL